MGGGIESLCVSAPHELKSRPSTSLVHPGRVLVDPFCAHAGSELVLQVLYFLEQNKPHHASQPAPQPKSTAARPNLQRAASLQALRMARRCAFEGPGRATPDNFPPPNLAALCAQTWQPLAPQSLFACRSAALSLLRFLRGSRSDAAVYLGALKVLLAPHAGKPNWGQRFPERPPPKTPALWAAGQKQSAAPLPVFWAGKRQYPTGWSSVHWTCMMF